MHFNWHQPSAPIFDQDLRIQPLNCKKGEIANRIITVGDPNRAQKFVDSFDKDTPVMKISFQMMKICYGKSSKICFT